MAIKMQPSSGSWPTAIRIPPPHDQVSTWGNPVYFCSSLYQRKNTVVIAIQSTSPPPNFMMNPASTWSVWALIPQSRGKLS